MYLRNKKTGEVVKIDLPIIDGDGWKISADSLAELNEDWEDYEPKEEKPKRYRLKKDLPTFKAGDEFFTDPYGSLWLDQEIDGEPNSSRVMAYNHSTLEKFPNILENWFEPIEPPEPLIKDEKIRKAVRVWAESWENGSGNSGRWAYWEEDGEEFHIARGDIETFFPVSNGVKDGEYTITELCGEEEE